MKISTIVFPVQKDKAFLSIKKEGFGAGFLNGYGGKKKEIDKTVEDTACRELFEESKVNAMDLEKVAVIDFFEEENQIFECHIYFCHKWEGELSETEEMGEPIAYDIESLPFDKMWHADRKWLPIVFSGEKIKAKAYYDKGMKLLTKFEYVPL